MLLSWTMLADKHLKNCPKSAGNRCLWTFWTCWLAASKTSGESSRPRSTWLACVGVPSWASCAEKLPQKKWSIPAAIDFLSQFEKARWICIFTYQKKLGGLGYARFTESLKVLALRKFNVLSNRCCLFSVLDTLPHSRSLECCVLLCVALKPHIFALGCLAWHALTVKHIGIYKECHVNVMVCCAHM